MKVCEIRCMENYILLVPEMDDGGQLVCRMCGYEHVTQKSMFCRSTHLKDKPALTQGDTISRVTLCDRVQRGLDCKLNLNPV